MSTLDYATAVTQLATAARDNTPIMVRRAGTLAAEVGRNTALARLTVVLQQLPVCGIAALAADALLRLAEQETTTTRPAPMRSRAGSPLCMVTSPRPVRSPRLLLQAKTPLAI